VPGYGNTAPHESGLFGVFEKRPPCQQNDYLGWIDRTKRESTRAKRLAQVLDERQTGTEYMKMQWNPGAPGQER